MNNLKVFGGTSNAQLAQNICAYLGIALGRAKVDRFPDGETIVKLLDDVRGRDVFVVQSTSPPVNENLFELLLFMDSLRRASAQRITAVIPYFGYARQDRKAEGRTPITAKLVANLITTAGANRVLAMDLHAEQIQGFFDIPLDHLSAEPVLSRYFRDKGVPNSIVVSPDVGNVKTANLFARQLGGTLAIIDKRRTGDDSIEMNHIIGPPDGLKGKNVLMFDDMITTAGTVTEAARLVREAGAQDVYVSATHAVFAGPAVERLRDADITQVTVTDSICLPQEVREGLGNLKILSIAELLGEAIRRIHRNESVSALFTRPGGKR